MKKFSIIAALALLPLISFAEEIKTESPQGIIEQESDNITDFQESYDEYIIDTNEIKTKAFMEYHFNFFSSSEIDIEYMEEIKEIQLNSSVQPSLSFGFDFESGRISINPAYLEIEDEEKILSISLKFDYIPFQERMRPYISLICSMNSVNVEYTDIAETAFGYGIGVGFLYDVNDNIFVNLGLNYSAVEFDIEDISMEISGFTFNKGFGYRF